MVATILAIKSAVVKYLTNPWRRKLNDVDLLGDLPQLQRSRFFTTVTFFRNCLLDIFRSNPH